MKRAVLYTRVSTLDQSVETQLLDLRQMAAARGYEIVREYTDKISGTKAKRPGLDALLSDARRRRFDAVIVWAFDRIARSVRHFLEVLDELNHLNIEFVSFRESVDTGGPLGRALIVIIGAISELERSLIVERVKAGMRRAGGSADRAFAARCQPRSSPARPTNNVAHAGCQAARNLAGVGLPHREAVGAHPRQPAVRRAAFGRGGMMHRHWCEVYGHYYQCGEDCVCICELPMNGYDHSDCPVELRPCPEHEAEQERRMAEARSRGAQAGAESFCEEQDVSVPHCKWGCSEIDPGEAVGWCFHCDHVYAKYAPELEDQHFAYHCPEAPQAVKGSARARLAKRGT